MHVLKSQAISYVFYYFLSFIRVCINMFGDKFGQLYKNASKQRETPYETEAF